MKIPLNNKRYMIVNIDESKKHIKISIYNSKKELERIKTINEVEFVDLFNILTYAQDHKKEIFRLWDAK